MKILLFGRNGQVGWELQRSLAPLGAIVALDAGTAHLCGDLSNLDGIARTVRVVAPDVIVNAAAHTAVDQAEIEPELAHTVNALAPQVLAKEALRAGAWLVHYSTDYVFDGSGDRPWTEADCPGPLNVYGATKLRGERAIQATRCRSLMFRSSWVYAARGANFARTMLRLALEREQLNVIDDQFGAPTGAELVADITAHALRHVWKNPADAGLYHLTASGETSWYGYAKHVLDQVASVQTVETMRLKELLPVHASAFTAVARRPHNSRLDTTKLQATFGLALPTWQIGVDRMLAEILPTHRAANWQ